MKLMIEITDDTQDKLITQAIKLGYKREYPNRAWTGKERREVVRWFVRNIIAECLTDNYK